VSGQRAGFRRGRCSANRNRTDGRQNSDVQVDAHKQRLEMDRYLGSMVSYSDFMTHPIQLKVLIPVHHSKILATLDIAFARTSEYIE
jgi:hypothetical protein